jgi:hypothetical protein
MLSNHFTQTYKYYSSEQSFDRAGTLSEIQQIQEQIVSKANTNEQSPDKAQDSILEIINQISKEAAEQLHLNNQSENNVSSLQANKNGAKAYLEKSSPINPEVIGAIYKDPSKIAGVDRPIDSKFTEVNANIEANKGIESVNSFDNSRTYEPNATNMKGQKAIDSIIDADKLEVETNVEITGDSFAIERKLDTRTQAHIASLETHLSHPIHGESISKMIDLLKGKKDTKSIKEITDTEIPKNLDYNFTLVAENLDRAGLTKEKSASLNLLTKELFGGIDKDGINLNLKTTSQLIDILYLDSASRENIFAKSGASREKVKLYTKLCDKLTPQDISTLRYVFTATEKGNFIPKLGESVSQNYNNIKPFSGVQVGEPLSK